MGVWPNLIDHAHIIYADFQSLGKVQVISYLEEDCGYNVNPVKRWSITVKSKHMFAMFCVVIKFHI